MKTRPAQVGRFCIDFQILDDQPDMARLMLVGMLVVRAEARYDMAAIEYTAYAEVFDLVEPGVQAPSYQAEFSTHIVDSETDDKPGRTYQVFERWARQ